MKENWQVNTFACLFDFLDHYNRENKINIISKMRHMIISRAYKLPLSPIVRKKLVGYNKAESGRSVLQSVLRFHPTVDYRAN